MHTSHALLATDTGTHIAWSTDAGPQAFYVEVFFPVVARARV